MSGLAAAILLVVPAWGQTFDAYQDLSGDNREPTPDIQGEPEDAADTGAVYARLLYLEGGISLRRSAELQTPGSELTANAPLVPGDEIWTGSDGRVEIQMAEGSIVRLSENARLSLMNLADVNGSFDTTNLLRLLNGSLYIHAENFDARQRRFQIDTPAGSVFLLSEGIFRIDVTASGATTVASFRGVAEVLAQESSVMAHSGERLTVAPGRAPGEAMAFNTLRRDSFDLWAEGRDDAIAAVRSARGPAPATMPAPVQPYVTELSHYGTWQDTPEYGWIWIPTPAAPDWQPYVYGHWVWAPIGMVWVSYEPWGYAPYHYGRWQFAPALGWFWAPGYVYAGAYVQWAVGPSYFGWCPLGFYGGPVIYAGFHHDCWTWVGHGDIYDHHVYRHAYSYADVARRHLEQNAYVMRTSPRAYPRYRPETAGAEIYRATRERRGAVPGQLDP
ncbi:MAG TPA: FecR family protein, partial [Candidatus Saccharimonadales bacterium]|nr:FecR family protein [Candidatus Saccharimonadales bacterium]